MNESLDEIVQTLLAPVPGNDPCGVSLRGESLFTDIRLAREEDDPSLPMRQWERPLKQADWAFIETACRNALAGRSKDLQLAAWLTEAWTRQGAGLVGLARGLLLLRELVARYWEGVHPRIDPPEEGGCESRIAPLDWLGERLAHTVRVHVGLLPLTDRKPASLSLADWERLVGRELSAASGSGSSKGEGDAPLLTREDVVDDVLHHQPQVIAERLDQARQAQSRLHELLALLGERLGPQAPHLRQLDAVLEAVQRVLLQLASMLPPPEVPTASDQVGDGFDGGEADPMHESPVPSDVDAAPLGPARESAQTLPVPPAGGWRDREEAYRTLETLADYLAAIEPHSPTPYLIRRAVNWGRLPLPDLMAEIMREEGDLNRLVQVLGLSR